MKRPAARKKRNMPARAKPASAIAATTVAGKDKVTSETPQDAASVDKAAAENVPAAKPAQQESSADLPPATKAGAGKAARKKATDGKTGAKKPAVEKATIEKAGGKTVADRPSAAQPTKDKVSRGKLKKSRVVCGVFKMPKSEYNTLRSLKKACKKAGVRAKKGELLRAGLSLLTQQTPAQIQALLVALNSSRDGHPAAGK